MTPQTKGFQIHLVILYNMVHGLTITKQRSTAAKNLSLPHTDPNSGTVAEDISASHESCLHLDNTFKISPTSHLSLSLLFYLLFKNIFYEHAVLCITKYSN